MKQAFSKQIRANVNWIGKLHEVCVDKIVENTEQPNRAVLIQAFSKQITGNVAWIVRVTRSQCRHDSRLTEQPIVDKIVDNTEQPLKAIQSTQTGQF